MEALEDKTYRGAGIASPSMAWVWGQLAGYSGPYHLVWSRDLYQVATAQLAAGDRAAAGRALDHLFGAPAEARRLPAAERQPRRHARTGAGCSSTRSPTRSCSRGSSGAPTRRRGATCAWRPSASSPTGRSRRSAGRTRTATRPRRSAREIAGLVAAAEIAERNGADADAIRYRAFADDMAVAARRVDRDDERPALGRSVLPAAERRRERGRGHDVRARRRRPDRRPARRRRPELPRARAARGAAGGRRRRCARRSRSWTASWRSTRRAGRFWHRYSHDGYGETATGGPFGVGEFENHGIGRAWPIFAGERGEYELAAGELSGDRRAARAAARGRLDAMAATRRRRADAARAGVGRAPAVGHGAVACPGTGTGSATPLGWTHAQFVRLAWSIDAGRPVERPAIVSCRYGGPCG